MNQEQSSEMLFNKNNIIIKDILESNNHLITGFDLFFNCLGVSFNVFCIGFLIIFNILFDTFFPPLELYELPLFYGITLFYFNIVFLSFFFTLSYVTRFIISLAFLILSYFNFNYFYSFNLFRINNTIFKKNNDYISTFFSINFICNIFPLLKNELKGTRDQQKSQFKELKEQQSVLYKNFKREEKLFYLFHTNKKDC